MFVAAATVIASVAIASVRATAFFLSSASLHSAIASSAFRASLSFLRRSCSSCVVVETVVLSLMFPLLIN
jgi:hypothetical protein